MVHFPLATVRIPASEDLPRPFWQNTRLESALISRENGSLSRLVEWKATPAEPPDLSGPLPLVHMQGKCTKNATNRFTFPWLRYVDRRQSAFQSLSGWTPWGKVYQKRHKSVHFPGEGTGGMEENYGQKGL